jgi:endoglucanase
MRAKKRVSIPRVLTAFAAAAATVTGLMITAPWASAASAGPVAMTHGFYVDPNTSAATWAAANPGDGRAAAIKSAIAATPMARWFGSWSGTIGTATGAYVGAAAYSGKLPILVAYNIPNRDICAGQSGGGAGSVAAYNSWIAAFASGIGTRPAIVVLEPDALGDESCMSQAQINERNGLLNNAIAQFASKAPNTWVYLDAGNPGWLPAATMAKHLNEAGLARAHGFSLNVSNFYATSQNVSYAGSVNAALNSYGYTRPFVVDTSRNGNGSNGEWCNPAGRKIGTRTQLGGGAEMLLWLKTPGESDGNCGVGTGSTAGQFLPQVAYTLVYGY